ncbi:family 78 glycoside hydrolase catalytic domain [Algibacillus agarilyticus]|uniref:family 78 glycoside hydrolase catalytic domain n=1 Tax=Algibacillus agarilyticus TaxID=2234133 RepID=UPI001E51CBB3|nr:alpha-L-rhamnosidase [Algibacillus agarilyticus]
MKNTLILVALLFVASCSSFIIKDYTQVTSADIQSKPLPSQNMPVKPSNLLVEGRHAPLNVHNQQAKLSWHANVVTQTKYQIQVASLKALLTNNKADLWDSGQVSSQKSLNIAYQGKTLKSNETAFWRVRVWSADNNKSDWSDIQSWEMGLTTQSDWQAKWIQVKDPVIAEIDKPALAWMTHAANIQEQNTDKLKKNKRKTQEGILEKLKQEPTASYFRHQFTVPNNKTLIKAKLHSTAAGYYEIFLNGNKVDDRIMDPGQTDYEERILYNTDNVNPLVNSGSNTIAVHLGSSWYSEDIAFSKWGNPDAKAAHKRKASNLSYGQPKFIAQLELTYNDGTTQVVTSNEQWLSHPSPILKEGVFSGEHYNAAFEVANWHNNAAKLNNWTPVEALTHWPTKTLEPQLLPAIRAVKEVTPTKIFNPLKNVWVYDFGQNFTGIPTINIKKLGLKKGESVLFRYAEWAHKDGMISQKSGGGAPMLKQVDSYVASGNDAETWTPKFTWHGFRYVEVKGLTEEPPLDAMTAHLVRSDVEIAGTFNSSDPLVNRVHDMALWSYEGNLMAVPMDCPIRERAGWTGDAHAALITGNYNYNMNNFWQKFLGDFQTSSHVAPAIVPGKRSHGGNFDWAAAEIMVAWEHYRHHDDLQTLADQYESMLEYMYAGEKRMENGLLRIGYGDWCDPVLKPGDSRKRCNPQYTSPTITSSGFYAHAANLMSKISTLLDKPKEAQYFANLFDSIKKQLHKEFYSEETGDYGSQTADALALQLDLAPKHLRQSIADALNKDVTDKWKGHGSSGALGQTYLYRALSDFGYGDTAFNIFKAEGYPGYAYQLDTLNATTLWERKGLIKMEKIGIQEPGRSLNHPFHSGYDGWFYEGLGGIRPIGDNPGFQHFALQPVFAKDLQFADVTYTTGYGTIKSNWKRTGNQVTWRFEIPYNSTALVTLPNKEQKLYYSGEYTLVYNPSPK